MTSKRETVAGAIYAEYCRRMHAVNGWEGIKSPAWEDLAESSRNDYRMTADAVFKELYTPTDAMIGAGAFKHSGAVGGPGDEWGEVSKIWRAMVHEAAKP